MKKSLILSVFALFFAFVAQAQTADEIIEKYLQNIGGKDKLLAIKSFKMTGKGKQGPNEFPCTIIQAVGGKEKTSFMFQGKDISYFDSNAPFGVLSIGYYVWLSILMILCILSFINFIKYKNVGTSLNKDNPIINSPEAND